MAKKLAPRTFTRQQRRNVNKWIKDLRSGDFKQGSGQLRYNDNYCCLGVLGQVHDLLKKTASAAWTTSWVTTKGDASYLDTPDFERLTGFPTSFQRLVAKKNDDLAWDFNKIADFIEKRMGQYDPEWRKKL